MIVVWKCNFLGNLIQLQVPAQTKSKYPPPNTKHQKSWKRKEKKRKEKKRKEKKRKEKKRKEKKRKEKKRKEKEKKKWPMISQNWEWMVSFFLWKIGTSMGLEWGSTFKFPVAGPYPNHIWVPHGCQYWSVPVLFMWLDEQDKHFTIYSRWYGLIPFQGRFLGFLVFLYTYKWTLKIAELAGWAHWCS